MGGEDVQDDPAVPVAHATPAGDHCIGEIINKRDDRRAEVAPHHAAAQIARPLGLDTDNGVHGGRGTGALRTRHHGEQE